MSSKLSIRTYKTFTEDITVLGTFTSPLYLGLEITNNTNQPIQVQEIWISLKIWYFFSKDVLPSRIKSTIKPFEKMSYQSLVDVRLLRNEYSPDQQFTVKVKTNEGIFHSSVVTMSEL